MYLSPTYHFPSLWPHSKMVRSKYLNSWAYFFFGIFFHIFPQLFSLECSFIFSSGALWSLFCFSSLPLYFYFLEQPNLSCKTPKTRYIWSSFSCLKGFLQLACTCLVTWVWSSRLNSTFSSEFLKVLPHCILVSSVVTKKFDVILFSFFCILPVFFFLSGILFLCRKFWNCMNLVVWGIFSLLC